MIEAFKHNFSKSFNIINANEEWVIEEKGKDATLKIAKLKYSRDIISIKNSVYQGWDKLLELFCNSNKKKWIRNLDCDGVAILEIEERKYIFFIELKSKFDHRSIFDAYKQIYYTLLKIHMLLSYCKGYYSNNVNAIGVISCLPPEPKKYEDISSEVALLLSKSSMTEEDNTETKNNNEYSDISFISNFYNIDSGRFDKNFKINIKDISFTKDAKLPSKLQNMSLDLSLVFAETEKSSEVNIALDSLI